MTVIVLTRCPAGLRGFLTRWLMEISPGVFIGRPSTRVREALWAEVAQYVDTGRAPRARGDGPEQGFAFATYDHKWHPIDYEGLVLIRRPKERPAITSATTEAPKGWSKASKRRRYGR
ncbi:type I-E CRISPR-associated endoribonuclease Cas2e [Streptosporangium sp. NPDC020145]|uniref:Type I-E CRISPR-associated endoribonuclease Cas2e n=1 Tax=Streptosporangium jomthongense TaxID=1193683 RepID=A0ABV8F7P0_9ACTN